jgi:hypothetical protein
MKYCQKGNGAPVMCLSLLVYAAVCVMVRDMQSSACNSIATLLKVRLVLLVANQLLAFALMQHSASLTAANAAPEGIASSVCASTSASFTYSLSKGKKPVADQQQYVRPRIAAPW